MIKAIAFFVVGTPLTLWGLLSLYSAFEIAFLGSADDAHAAGSFLGISILPIVTTLIGLALLYAGKNTLSDIKAEKEGNSEGFKNITN